MKAKHVNTEIEEANVKLLRHFDPYHLIDLTSYYNNVNCFINMEACIKIFAPAKVSHNVQLDLALIDGQNEEFYQNIHPQV